MAIFKYMFILLISLSFLIFHYKEQTDVTENSALFARALQQDCIKLEQLMTKVESGELETICPVETQDINRCCVALICSKSLVAEGIGQGMMQYEKMYLSDRFDNSNALFDSKKPVCYEIVLINARLIQYPLSDFFSS